MRAEQIGTIIDALRDVFDLVVIDMPARFCDELVPAFSAADRILLVTVPEISSVRNSKTSLLVLDNLGISKDKVQVVLNRSNANKHIRPQDVQRTLDRELYGNLREDVRAVTMSLNEGRPLVQSGKGRGLAKDYQLLAYKFLSEMGRGPEEQPRSLFAKRHI